MEHLTLDQLRTSAETGAVLGVTLRASGAGFFVCAETRRGESTLITTRDKKPRRFVDSGKALRLLQALGIEKATVNLTHWRPDEIEFERKPRPDRAAAMRETFDAAAYDRAFRADVEAALREADDPATKWVAHDKVMTKLDRKVAKLAVAARR